MTAIRTSSPPAGTTTARSCTRSRSVAEEVGEEEEEGRGVRAVGGPPVAAAVARARAGIPYHVPPPFPLPSLPTVADRGSTSNAGGRTSKGSGTPYYGGNSYRGGAAVPFKAGSASPGGLRPSLMALAAAATLLPGAWLLGAYLYHTSDAHTFHSSSPSTSGDGPRNGTETLPVLCVCSEHSVCGCDSSANDTYYDALYDTARRTPADADSYAAIIANVNGTRTLVINGTLANGTTAPGGNDATSSASSGIFGSSAVPFAHKWGALVVVAVVVALLSS